MAPLLRWQGLKVPAGSHRWCQVSPPPFSICVDMFQGVSHTLPEALEKPGDSSNGTIRQESIRSHFNRRQWCGVVAAVTEELLCFTCLLDLLVQGKEKRPDKRGSTKGSKEKITLRRPTLQAIRRPSQPWGGGILGENPPEDTYPFKTGASHSCLVQNQK